MDQDPVCWLYSLQTRGIKLGLEGIRSLLDLLGRPEEAFPSVLVGGTNGKGSVSAMLDAILAAAGRRTGLYTSPHLMRPNERIRVAGEDVGAPELDALLLRVRAACEEGLARGALAAHPSFFEVITAAAMLAFRDAKVDAAVLEVGLGGRLDATNVASPVASVIVTVDLDHVAQLGSTLEAIAAEKAGIARRGRPVVTGVVEKAPLRVIRERCREAGAFLIEAVRVASIEDGPDGTFAVTTATRRYGDLRLALAGAHQRENARVAIVALEAAAPELGIVPRAEDVRRGLRAVRWPGRLQSMGGDPPVLLDGAHNPAGARALASHLDQIGAPPPVLVFAVMRDKAIEPILEPLASRAATVIATRPHVERAADADAVAAVAARWTRAEAIADPVAALARARDLARQGPAGTQVLVAGSLYVVGEILSTLTDPTAPGPVGM